MRVLAFDTSGPIITVGTAENARTIARRDVRAERGKGNVLEQIIDDVLDDSHWSRRDVDGLGLIIGPGSLTAIRIGWATAAGWAQARRIPVVGWSVPDIHSRKLGDRSRHAACCTHYRGDTFLLYNLSNPDAHPATIRLKDDSRPSRVPTILTGPGVVGNRENWSAYLGSETLIVPDDEAVVGADQLAIWAEADLLRGHSLSISTSPLEYGLPPDFKKLTSI